MKCQISDAMILMKIKGNNTPFLLDWFTINLKSIEPILQIAIVGYLLMFIYWYKELVLIILVRWGSNWVGWNFRLLHMIANTLELCSCRFFGLTKYSLLPHNETYVWVLCHAHFIYYHMVCFLLLGVLSLFESLETVMEDEGYCEWVQKVGSERGWWRRDGENFA